ncbi:30S ribosomal protein S6 [Lyticum sinuosum]|uniref:Small ribosomal subunit protein bS6 n=1 Tax=Lyticum sinuosum TaxID=1332059 RepID=A0AAE5AGQ9_9RICK|nr:30S ribosomal protein S6 [Lyticum sinuosum]MDZ5761087.1 30S ribosomal protein S6 [Lyticum sinuosum]
MKKYEILLVFHEMSHMDASSILNGYINVINTNGGKIIQKEDWGNKQFAFPIKSRKKGKKYNRGYYNFLIIEGNANIINEMHSRFKVNRENVLRFNVIASPQELTKIQPADDVIEESN